MKFTIFTAFYNYLDTFDELVESILSQTHTDWEWLIVNDFSENPDVEKRLLELENNPKIKRIQQARKKEFYFSPPVKYSTGDIMMVMDSDDIMHPKLLEVYNYNFNKFPEVQLISTNSIIKNDSIKGMLRSYRHIHYKENKHLYEAMLDQNFEYNWGDCRAWRNNINTFEPNCKWQYCAEDFIKMLMNEEKGELLYLPRTLHTYAYRENSISHLETFGANLAEEFDNMKKDSDSRIDRTNLNSINKYYDNSYYQTTPFYLSRLNLERDKCSIELFSPSSTYEDKRILRELYFDQNLYFSETENVDYFIAKITNTQELKELIIRLEKGFPKKQIVIEIETNMINETDEKLSKILPPWYWFEFFKYRIYFVDFS